METYKGSKSYAFMALYLMGIEKHVLEKDFMEDYAYSGALTILDDVKDAKIIRYASRIRQKIYRNYAQYRSVRNSLEFDELVARFFSDEYVYLKEHGIDLGKSFRSDMTIVPVINTITTEISKRIKGVLKALKFRYTDLVEQVFYMYDVTDVTLDKYIKSAKSHQSKFPYMLFITRFGRLGTYLSFLFQNDKNFVLGCHKLSDKSYLMSNLDLTPFDWSSLEAEVTVRLPITRSSQFYVDCDNVNYFSFIGLLEALKLTSKPTDKHTFNLYIDEVANKLWSVTTHLEHPLFDIKIVEVDRVKDQKSLVDIVMVAHIAQNSTLSNALDQVIVSSDSDFLGVIKAGVQVATVLYEQESVNTTYLGNLKQNRVTAFNIGSLATPEFIQKHENRIITQFLLEYLNTAPVTDWTVEKLTKYMLSGGEDITNFDMNLVPHNIEYLAKKVLSNVEVIFKDGKCSIELKEEQKLEEVQCSTNTSMELSV